MGIKSRLSRVYFPEAGVSDHAKRLGGDRGFILMYHEVLPAESSTVPAWTVVRAEEFEQQMQLLKRHFDVVTLNEARERLTGTEKAERPFVVITFDDGYSGNLHTVLPIMQAYNLPFTVYVATKAIKDGSLYWYDQLINLMTLPTDTAIPLRVQNRERVVRIKSRGPDNQRWRHMQDLLASLKTLGEKERDEAVEKILSGHRELTSELRMLTPGELRELAADPLVSIECHTHAHELLDELSDERILSSVSTANELIEGWTGRAPSHFAYPNGNTDQRVASLISAAGFETAVTTVHRHCAKGDDLLALPRIGVGRFDNHNVFKAKLAGFL
ncbi:polysaccharide deacetylase family protein [Marinobacter sp. X15-166B]|uniref:polysaccharide deacetylase family protein n=1 Tax=Marinobacter sp. X15-166B TaxID=1897620 RepID=UPI00085CD814|nr:polysaccharide deacetylase family protein [Marinobacter sp. X15-166B]OEY67755.1 hypothetical protein BG841_15845 [Marinobacter sp. X15-166B]